MPTTARSARIVTTLLGLPLLLWTAGCPVSVRAAPDVVAVTRRQPLPPDAPHASENEEFWRIAGVVRMLVVTHPERFPEIDYREINGEGKLPDISWRATEHHDLECAGERTESSETRRPFCLQPDGQTVILSATYFGSVAQNDRERMALVAGVLFRVAGIDGSTNRALALRVADLALEKKITTEREALDVLREKSGAFDRAIRNVYVRGGGALQAEKGATSGFQGNVSGALEGSRFQYSGLDKDDSPTLTWALRGRLGHYRGAPVYNVDANFQFAPQKLLFGLWVALRANQFATYREAFGSIGAALLTLPVSLGGDDYLLFKVNAGAIPIYAAGAPGKPAVFREALFNGINLDTEVLYRSGAFFLNFVGEGSRLKDANPHGDLPEDLHYRRIELTVAAGATFKLVTDKDQVALEARYNSLKPEGRGIPEVDYEVKSIGASYGFSWW